MRAMEEARSMGWTGSTGSTGAARRTRVWMVRDRRAGWKEENGEPRAPDPETVGPAGAKSVGRADSASVESVGIASAEPAGGASVEPEETDAFAGARAPDTPDLSPPDDDDARELRMERVAVLYGEITAATRGFLAAVAECDRHRDWAHAGFGSGAEWLAWRIGVTRSTANEKVRVALALEELPLTSEAMARTGSAARAPTAAGGWSERVILGWTNLDDADEAERERALHRSRRFSVFPGEDGMYVVRGRLTPEVAAVLMRAVEAGSDALFRKDQDARNGRKGEGRTGERGDEGQQGEVPDPAQLRADAVGLVAERALAAGFRAPDAPISGSRAERYQVMLHVEEKTLEQKTLEQDGHGRAGCPSCAGSGGSEGTERCGSDGSGLARIRSPGSDGGRRKGSRERTLSERKDGTRITAVTARRLSCDAARVVVRTKAGGDGSISDATAASPPRAGPRRPAGTATSTSRGRSRPRPARRSISAGTECVNVKRPPSLKEPDEVPEGAGHRPLRRPLPRYRGVEA